MEAETVVALDFRKTEADFVGGRIDFLKGTD